MEGRSRHGGTRARRSKRESRPVNEIALDALLAFVTIGSVLAIGAVHVPTILVLGVLSAIAAFLAFRLGPALPLRDVVRSPIGVGLALSAFTLVQIVPLPMAALKAIATVNADVWSRSLLPFSESGPRFAPLSLDPGATLVEAIKWLTYTSIFACAMLLARRRGRVVGVILVFASGIVLAVVTIAHGLGGMSKVYGFYEPHFGPAPWHVGPLLNPNNLSGYLNLAAMCGLGLLLSRQRTIPRWALALGIAVLAAVVVIAASRGGVIALVLGLLLVTALFAGGSQRTASSALPKRTAVLLLLAVTAGGALYAILGSTRETWAELYDKNLLKVRMLAWAKPMIADYRWFGTGRGAFESVFPAYRLYAGNVVFTHAENFPAQWLAEWGVPAAVLAFAALAWFLRPAALGIRRSVLAMGVGVGIGILLLQNLFDLGLEVPSICIALAVAFASIWGGWGASSEFWRGSRRDEPQSSWLGWLAPAVMAVLVMLALKPLGSLHDVAGDREDTFEDFRSWMKDKAPSKKAALYTELRDAMMRHPADPYFPLLMAEVAWRGGAIENPMPALSRSLERASENGNAHLLLAEILGARGARSQSRLELRLAVGSDPGLAPAAAQMAVRVAATTAELLEAVPAGVAGVSMINVLYGVARDADRLPLLNEVVKRDPKNSSAHTHLAEYYLAELTKEEGSAVCADARRSDCERAFEASVAFLERTHPNLSRGAQFRAKLLLARGKPEEAEAFLASRCSSATDNAGCQYLRARAAASVKGNAETLHAALRDLQQAACVSPAECASTALTIGDMLAARGEWGTALTHYKRACQIDSSENAWMRVADAASRVGAHKQAADALEKVAHLRGGADAGLRVRIQAERDRAMGLVLHE